jgi:DNA-directed RNA polymerase subunit omega
MNPEFLKKALEKVGNPNILVNLISRRVRQLNYGERPFLIDTGTLGAADIALREIIEEKMGWEEPEIIALVRPVRKKARRR